MASGERDETYQEALMLCLDDMEHGSALPLARGVRTGLGAAAEMKFQANHPAWPANREKVRRAAAFIGRFAELFALFDGSPAVRDADVARAVIIVKKLCTAQKEGAKLAWCPDMPDPAP
jgi:hypothetical protein